LNIQVHSIFRIGKTRPGWRKDGRTLAGGKFPGVAILAKYSMLQVLSPMINVPSRFRSQRLAGGGGGGGGGGSHIRNSRP